MKTLHLYMREEIYRYMITAGTRDLYLSTLRAAGWEPSIIIVRDTEYITFDLFLPKEELHLVDTIAKTISQDQFPAGTRVKVNFIVTAKQLVLDLYSVG